MLEEIPPPDAAITLSEFRQILVWPLTIAFGDDASSGTRDIADLVKGEARRLDGNTIWKRVADPLYHVRRETAPLPADPKARQEAYAEFVYFHDFVQRFIYPKPEDHRDGRTLLHLFERTDIASVRITQSTETSKLTVTLGVERCNLYLFPVGVAILALEVTTAGTKRLLTLAEALHLQDGFRRCYVPWFSGVAKSECNGDVAYTARAVSDAVEWLDAGGDVIPFGGSVGADPAYSFEAARDFVVAHREAPMFRHWAKLLPLRLDRNKDADASVVRWRHIVDERIPVMTYARIAAASGKNGPLTPGQNLARIERGDLIRLCFVDTPGPAGSLPYDKFFLEQFDGHGSGEVGL